MRTPLPQKNKRTVKIVRMKSVPVKCKKQSETSDKDYVSETISFVIKGKLTPIKPTFVSKKTKKSTKKKEIGNNQKTNMMKSKKGNENSKNPPKVQMKTAKKPTSASKVNKKNSTDTNADQDSLKKDIKTECNTPPNKNETTKKVLKEPKIRKVKTEKVVVVDEKKKPKRSVSKKIKSPQKSEPADKDKDKNEPKEGEICGEPNVIEDIKTKQTIERLLKQANKALKPHSKKSKSTLQNKKTDKPHKKVKLQGKIDAAAVKNKCKVPKQSPVKQEANDTPKKQTKRKSSGSQEDTTTSDDLTLNELCSESKIDNDHPKSKKIKIKNEPVSDSDKKSRKATLKKMQKKLPKANLVLMTKRIITGVKDKVKRKEKQRAKKMKLFSFWNGPKRHRVASLNALAKVHCLYENESRANLLDPIEEIEKKESVDERKTANEEVPCTRTLRSVPGLRAVGKHWDMTDTTSSSEDNSGYESTDEKPKSKARREIAKKSDNNKKPEQKRKRNRAELIMDLKDMVVRKRMASLNASAILAASYSVEKRASKSPKSDSDTDSSDYFHTDNEEETPEKKCFETKVKKEEDGKLIEVRATPNKKVAVILNQDTDVTITGVYVNSTTRSTHHEGYCSIAGMQYRISATSHTQTAATAVATETLLQSSSSSTQDNSNSDSLASCKSYTPLDALSNMQPPPGPGIQHGVAHQHMGPPQHVLPLPQHQLSPKRRHGCTSAFSSPHAGPPYPAHHPPLPGEPGYVHGYYQPAGPLISVPPHGHTQQQQAPPPVSKSVPLSESSPTSASPIHQPPLAPSSNGDSSDSEVIITSVTTGKDTIPPPQQPPSTYRYSQYPGTPPGYPYAYPPHYYPTPPPAPSYAHHDLCYSASPYLHHKYPPTAYRRYLPSTQYYAPNPPDIYATPPTAPSQQNQQVVTATPVSASSSSYQPPPSGPPPAIMEPYPPPPPPTLVETYPHPPHYYPSYGPAPPPSCYSHSPATRTLPYINATYQSCPCPMQSCPKNVHTGPLTGDSKRSNISAIAKDSMPLPPVALALPLEPASATGPPSPARGSAGMPPPPSPAGATYQPPPAPKQEENIECNPVEKKRKARVGKAMVRNNIAAVQNTMLLMCNPNQRNFPGAGEVKREIESPKEKESEEKKEVCSDDEMKKVVVVLEEQPEIKNIERIPEPQNLKKEETFEEKNEEAIEEPLLSPPLAQKLKEELQPCVNTVAENVKVKNMKRKMSVSKEKKEEEGSPLKKVKVEPKYNGSYKDLIKKETTTIKINNGKRKLITENYEITTRKQTKAKPKKQATKRKLSSTKEGEPIPNKRLKQTKPLTTSNQQNSKPYSKEKDKNKTEPVLIENKEPQKKSKKLPVNSKPVKKLAPAILDSLIAKNSINRTIESVIESVRTNGSVKCAKNNKEPVLSNKKSTNTKNGQTKNKPECRKSVVTRRKSKNKDTPQSITRVPRRSLHSPRWSNGWTWEGKSYEAKVFINSDETTLVRKCYPAMRHEEGDVIEVRDCVLLKAGPRKNDLPFVAKIAYLWENPDDGEMMMSLLWYYRPEHTEQGRTPADQPDEVFASRHKDSNSVACIDDKCYVLTFHEYCRYRKDLRRLEEGIEETSPCFPIPEPYPRNNRQPPSPLQVSSDMVFFCRRVYDFRQKRIVKNPS